MSTRSLIARPHPTKPDWFEALYCHYDGYPHGVGKTLYDHYDDEGKIDQLFALGSLSSLGIEIGEKHDFDANKVEWCRAYHRDRNEEWRPNLECSSEADLITQGEENWAEYIYLWNGDDWLVRGNSSFVPVRDLASVQA